MSGQRAHSMGDVFPQIDDRIADFIQKQHLFFVATAPLNREAHVNVSPKGLESFTILDPLTVAYADLVGSGIETIAHLRENGRIVIMFCSFDGPPKIVRLHGVGEWIEPGEEGFEELRERLPSSVERARAIVRVRVQRVADSCGFGVPRYQYKGERDQLHRWANKKGDEGLRTYASENNRESIDELPGLRLDQSQ